MTRICNTIQIRQPIEEVFDFITTPGNWPQWHPASVSVGGNADHSLLPGEAVTENISVAGHRGQVTLSPHPDGTNFERELVYAMPNPLLAVLDWLIIRSRMKGDSAEALRRLKRLLESSGEIN